MLPNAFITGGSGLLGLNILLHSSKNYNFYALENKRQIKLPGVKAVKVDLGNLISIKSFLQSNRPQLVIHSAGMTNVDACNLEPDKANFINGVLPGNLSKVCWDLGIKFVLISTDHLFDGTESFLNEEASTRPVNAYGSSKAFGETEAMSNNPDALVVRCNFFGWGPSYKPSFSDFIFSNLSKGKPIRLVDDIYYTPALAQNLINTIYSLVNVQASGIFNVVGSERVTKYEFGVKMAKAFEWDLNLIELISWSSLEKKAKRPSDMSLCDRKLRGLLGYGLGTVEENILALKSLVNTNLYNEVKRL